MQTSNISGPVPSIPARKLHGDEVKSYAWGSNSRQRRTNRNFSFFFLINPFRVQGFPCHISCRILQRQNNMCCIRNKMFPMDLFGLVEIYKPNSLKFIFTCQLIRNIQYVIPVSVYIGYVPRI
ncbi:hypothetical protein V8G54_005864 [Vigna mungo]|uniref:Uncharacterized protein n=1 Tax=Vigna mungo TaxID=3915 RepID=A0AAQ3S5W9_VIGMU